MKVRSRMGIAAFAALAATIGIASFAWACTSTTGPYLNNLSPNRGPAGTVVRVSGGGWAAGAVSLAMAGETVGSASTSGGTFSTTITVKQKSAGFYYVTATQNGVSRSASFEITVPKPANTAPTPRPTPQVAPQPQPNTSKNGPGAGVAGQAAGAAAGRSSSGTQAGQAGQAARAGSPSGSSSLIPGGSASGQAAPTADTAQSVTGQAATAPTPQSALDDLWSGFAQGPSDNTGLDTVAKEKERSPAVLGAQVLSVGLALLFGGFALAESRRRRALVGPTRLP